MEDIVLLATLYQVKNFKPCNNYICILAKNVDIMIRNISNEILKSWLEEIWKNQKLVKLEKLVRKEKDWFVETLQQII